MSSSAVQRLQSALDRLLTSKPERVKSTGKLTLNKINNEAGFGHSYVHKFPDFVAKATLIIDKYNEAQSALVDGEQDLKCVQLSDVEKLRIELIRERKLKDRYRREKDDLNLKLKELEVLNNSLMYRVFELQDEIGSSIEHID